MITILYGASTLPFVERSLRDFQQTSDGDESTISIMSVETLPARISEREQTSRLYVLPFDAPADWQGDVESNIEKLFPNAKPVTSFPLQDTCWNRLELQQHLLERGVVPPQSIVSYDPEEAISFVRKHHLGLPQEPLSIRRREAPLFSGWKTASSTPIVAVNRYTITLNNTDSWRLDGTHLKVPAPYYLQAMIGELRSAFPTPGRRLRAFVADRKIAFWTEYYRDQFTRPSDFVLSPAQGAQCRFVQVVSEEEKKTVLRCVDALSLRFGSVDIIRAGDRGPYVIDVDVDGRHMMINRDFKWLPEVPRLFQLRCPHRPQLLVEAHEESEAEEEVERDPTDSSRR